jgi:hypothetical protein
MYNFGRLEVPDSRDLNYGISNMLMSAPQISEKFWWDGGWWGNQGETTRCVAYSWAHWLEDGPIIQDAIPGRPKPLFDPTDFYNACKKVDQWPGEDYSGTSVRAGATVLKDVGVITEYRWAFNLDEIILTLLTLGPMVIGSRWYQQMQFPDQHGLIRPKGRVMGGHAYLLNGVDVNREYFRIKNSWGTSWGDKGHAYISFSDFEKIFKRGGEACIASEVKINEVPSLDWIKPI